MNVLTPIEDLRSLGLIVSICLIEKYISNIDTLSVRYFFKREYNNGV